MHSDFAQSYAIHLVACLWFSSGSDHSSAQFAKFRTRVLSTTMPETLHVQGVAEYTQLSFGCLTCTLRRQKKPTTICLVFSKEESAHTSAAEKASFLFGKGGHRLLRLNILDLRLEACFRQRQLIQRVLQARSRHHACTQITEEIAPASTSLMMCNLWCHVVVSRPCLTSSFFSVYFSESYFLRTAPLRRSNCASHNPVTRVRHLSGRG